MEEKHSSGVLGTFVDSRDGQTYRTVQIGEQVWMAENLNYEDGVSECGRFGRLYSWEAAKAACPSGWHLPSEEEFKTLIETEDGDNVAGKMLKSEFGWGKYGNGTDDYGFSALPAGDRIFYYACEVAYFWSGTENDAHSARSMRLYSNSDDAYLGVNSKRCAFSVRCIKESE